jgi:hypothetical protein
MKQQLLICTAAGCLALPSLSKGTKDPHNMAWGEDGHTLFVTGGGSVYRLRLATKGARY